MRAPAPAAASAIRLQLRKHDGMDFAAGGKQRLSDPWLSTSVDRTSGPYGEPPIKLAA